MTFYDPGLRKLKTGSYVQLGTQIGAVIELTNNIDGLFDINIRSCDASGISLIEARSPVDGALFRGFNKTSRGVVVNSFAMFRTTSMRREPVSMMFSCVLEVCYAPCVEYICDGTEAVAMVPRWRRTAGGVAREVSLTTIFSVGMEALPTSVVLPCEGISRVIAVSVLAAVSALWLSSISVATYYLREWRSITHKHGGDSGQRDHEQSTNRETIQGHI
ncbi:hypothetical protein DPMN_043981 [Dreissena polymorpha]|uniref:ZP domain-containing protein n=2 Tax=Dreissena polymorpha TaxID=45954 RepID=A0A9D4D3Q8_DREPO|nr:hypothetical protein DPMN_043981 [Dreissena polymorpha]